MKTIPLIIVLALITVAPFQAPQWADARDLCVGSAAVDITPPVGYRMSGYFFERLNTGVHDPLFAKALYFQQDQTTAAIVCCDLIGMTLDVTNRARRLAAQRTGVPAEHILIAATHTHTGPLYMGALRQAWHDQAVAEHGHDPHEKINYADKLVDYIVQAIEQAKANAEIANLSVATAQRHGLSFNRRFHMADGSVRFNPGKLNPNIVKPAGPIDPDVHVLAFDTGERDRPFAGLTVFALHLDTVGGAEYSGDFPHYLQQSLRNTFGPAFLSVFGNGACGDINHIDVTNRDRQKGHGEAQRIGDALAETVKAAWPKLNVIEKPSLAAARAVIDVHLQQYSKEQIAQARQAMKNLNARGRAFLEKVEAYKIVALQHRGGDTIALETQVLRLADDVAIVGVPGELFVDLGLAIKRDSPFKHTVVIELGQDAPGYIPTRKAFAEGSYETVNSRIQPGGGEKLVDASVGLLRKLKN